MSRSEITYLLKKHHIDPDSTKGQSFLVDDDVLGRIVTAASLTKHDAVLEIGPGLGNLTALLAKVSRRVMAVELDQQFKQVLDPLALVNTNLKIMYGNALDIPWATIDETLDLNNSKKYKIVANIPYYITARLLKCILAYPEKPESIVLLIQQEVAERITARPGDHTKLSLSIQLYSDPEILFQVPKKHFYPKPDVDSAVIRLNNVHAWNHDGSEKRLWQLIAFGFSAKRKKLVNNLCAGLVQPRSRVIAALSKAGIEHNVRAQELSIKQWLSLMSVLGRT
jgi:16S rRNA (adenine1518-N6/adenine1519-N6)-dimethyltransferase